MNGITSWKNDPNIVAALKSRQPDDVSVMQCPQCGDFSYYNQGSHFTCRVCDAGYYAATEDEACGGIDGPYVLCEDALSVADLIDSEVDDEIVDDRLT